MNAASRQVQRTYLFIMLFNTLAAAFIWGVNTLFLLDAGLSNFEAFAANAFFTAGMVLFEIPTGAIADIRGRRLSFLLGAATLAITTLLYLYLWEVHAPFWAWAMVSLGLGLGFAFISGAIEAWLVDALHHSKFTGRLEAVFAKGEIVQGSGMLVGSGLGGIIAQFTNLGVPYVIRAIFLVITLAIALKLMHDEGFQPVKKTNPLQEIKDVLQNSLTYGWRQPSIRWTMLGGFFVGGVMIYVGYALQPYLLQLYGDSHAYGIAGLSAAIFAGSQIVGGAMAPIARKLFHRRTSLILACSIIGTVTLFAIGIFQSFWVAIVLIALWASMFAAIMPVRQAYLNDLIPSQQRATVLSFDSLFSSAGGVIGQPVLGKIADLWSYPVSYVCSALFQAISIPFIWLARRQRVPSDTVQQNKPKTPLPNM
jgi:MFS family permease